MTTQIKASVIGVTGYTGLELVRILHAHPDVDIAYLTSRTDNAKDIGESMPWFKNTPYTLSNTDYETVAKESDIVFLALPHKASQDVVKQIIGKTKIIDLGADFRLKDADIYQHYYGEAHSCPEFFENFVYGAPEFSRSNIQSAQNVANPGCYALLLQLMLYPFKGNINKTSIMAVTGASGFGKTENALSHFPVYDGNMQSYKVNAHRHTPEILATTNLSVDQINIVPTLGPFTRGIFATAFIELSKEISQSSPLDIYENESFIRNQDTVTVKNIVSSNYCDISVQKGIGNTVIVQGALDNLTKGSSGNAVQCMNLMFGLNEKTGLDTILPVYP